MAEFPICIGLVTEALIRRPLTDVMDWLVHDVPEITGLEVGTGAYAPTNHCNMPRLLSDASARRAFDQEIAMRGLHIAALNVWGNPLHPDPTIGDVHDRALRDTIRLAAELGVDRVVGMAGCPAATKSEHSPHFAAGGWLPYLEDVYERQWNARVQDYWTRIGEFARSTHPELLICLELHPGTVAYNVETFERLAALSPAIAANIDPSHFFWMGMDANKVTQRLGARIGHAHGKDVVFQPEKLALNGLLDRRWPTPPEEMPWNFATVGHGHDANWWRGLLNDLRDAGRVRTISIEHEDPFVAPEIGIREAAQLLSAALKEPRTAKAVA
jgi:sugar phosphate isomerase/epimerase